MCEEYEYEPHGVGSTGHATPNMGVRTRVQKPRPMGLLAAHNRSVVASKRRVATGKTGSKVATVPPARLATTTAAKRRK